MFGKTWIDLASVLQCTGTILSIHETSYPLHGTNLRNLTLLCRKGKWKKLIILIQVNLYVEAGPHLSLWAAERLFRKFLVN